MSAGFGAAFTARQRILALAGAVLYPLPLGGRLLATWPVPWRRSGRLEDLAFKAVYAYWLRSVFLAEPDPDRREALKGALMGGLSGAAWAEHYDSVPVDLDARVGTMAFREACPLLPELDKALGGGEPAFVVQLGASSGRELAWLASRHPRHEYLGTDVYPEVAAFASRRHGRPGLRFEAGGALDVPSALKGRDGKAVIISSGSLQYVQPEHVERLFAALAKRPNTELRLLEPATDSTGPPDRAGRSVWAGNLAFSHDYRACAQRAGWEVADCRVLSPYLPYGEHPDHRNTVHYYLAARTTDR